MTESEKEKVKDSLVLHALKKLRVWALYVGRSMAPPFVATCFQNERDLQTDLRNLRIRRSVL